MDVNITGLAIIEHDMMIDNIIICSKGEHLLCKDTLHCGSQLPDRARLYTTRIQIHTNIHGFVN